MALTLTKQTKAEFAARFWDAVKKAYQANDKEAFARLVWWLYQRVLDGTFTSNEVRNSYNNAYNKSLTSSEWNTFVNDRIIPIAERYQEILDEADL